MAGVDAQCCEMAMADPQAADLWEQAYSDYEDYVSNKNFAIESDE